MSLPFYRYIELDGNKYAVATSSYVRKWARVYSTDLVAGLIRLNFMDRGPGVRVYDFTLILETWAPGTQPYQDGITQTWDVQMQNLEASYAKLSTVLQFPDPCGQSPGSSAQYGVFFLNLNQIIPNYATPQKPVVLCEVEVTEATQQVA